MTRNISISLEHLFHYWIWFQNNYADYSRIVRLKLLTLNGMIGIVLLKCLHYWKMKIRSFPLVNTTVTLLPQSDIWAFVFVFVCCFSLTSKTLRCHSSLVIDWRQKYWREFPILTMNNLQLPKGFANKSVLYYIIITNWKHMWKVTKLSYSFAWDF